MRRAGGGHPGTFADPLTEVLRACRGSEVEKLWTSKLRSFRNRLLAIPNRLRDLPARQSVSLTQELRAALTELADGG